MWEELLGVGRVGLEDNFFDLGGHSLLLVKVHARLQKLLAREVAIVDLFKYPTISALAAYLGDKGEAKVKEVSESVWPLAIRPREPIAVVAMAGRFPGANSVEELWQNLLEGKEGIRFFNSEELIAG